MPEVLVVGAGVGGLSTAMLLAADGHEVTVLERDPAPPPSEPEQAWQGWERRGVNQFHLPHFFPPRFRALVESELPRVADALDAVGALRFNPLEHMPLELTGGHHHGDEDFEILTGRRPVVESALALVAGETPGVVVSRGVAVNEALTGPEPAPGVPHITGVRTEQGEELRADLIVDASGRRSPVPRWLTAVGARPVEEELEDCGFIYYGRHFRSTDGSIPPMLGPLFSHYGSVSVLTLPADNGTWAVGIVASATDGEMRGLRDPDVWSAAMKRFPLVAHWADGEPLDDTVVVMAKIEDRLRRYVWQGRPVATGVVPLGDAWACTNPSLGRGATMALLHALELRDLLRRRSADDRLGFATAWDEVTRATVEPWYRTTLQNDRQRLAQVEAAIRGEPYESGDEAWDTARAMEHASTSDPDLLRGLMRITGMLSSPEEVLAQPGFLEKVKVLGVGWRQAHVLGPSRDELVQLVAA